MSRIDTDPAPPPGTRTSWKRTDIVPPVEQDGVVQFGYEVYADDVATRPFLVVNHKAQLRENHQLTDQLQGRRTGMGNGSPFFLR